MPKLVDHDRRRAEIVSATWQLIARRGIDATTMREIARELGMANGALVRYFPDKNAIIRSAFEHVFEATNDRVRRRLDGASGLAALRVFCDEVVPAEDETLLEARVVVPFWQRAIIDPELGAVFDRAMRQWRTWMAEFLTDARAAGEVRCPVPDDVLVEQLLAILCGLQILAALTPEPTDPALQRRMVDAFIEGLRSPPD